MHSTGLELSNAYWIENNEYFHIIWKTADWNLSTILLISWLADIIPIVSWSLRILFKTYLVDFNELIVILNSILSEYAQLISTLLCRKLLENDFCLINSLIIHFNFLDKFTRCWCYAINKTLHIGYVKNKLKYIFRFKFVFKNLVTNNGKILIVNKKFKII